MLLTPNVCTVQEYIRGTVIIHENQRKNFIRKHILSQGKTLMSFLRNRNLHYSFFGLQQNYKNYYHFKPIY